MLGLAGGTVVVPACIARVDTIRNILQDVWPSLPLPAAPWGSSCPRERPSPRQAPTNASLMLHTRRQPVCRADVFAGGSKGHEKRYAMRSPEACCFCSAHIFC
uniref:Uncharacterized protein n=1 Tax=Chlamydomonas euryale TaxID=1486919 RepID=A0A7R9YSA4_9CHLO